MTYDEYVEGQQKIVGSMLTKLLAVLNPFRALSIASSKWVFMLASIYQIIVAARNESSELAREFYDSERERVFGPNEPRHDLYLASYKPEWLHEAMEDSRDTFSQADASESAMAHVAGIAIKQVENAGRTTILRAVDTDPKVQGWARVAGGTESCAFCQMLISRGPVYQSKNGRSGAQNAGLDADDVSAVEIWKQYDQSGDDSALDELMTRWHENCDCKVVPVFDRANWPGRDQYLEAERLWIEVTKGQSGSDKLRAFRRFIEAAGNKGKQDLPLRPAA